MTGFWTCGPFKEIQDRREKINFRMEQTAKFMDILEDLKQVEERILSGSLEEKYIGLMMKTQIERDLNTILGIKEDEREETDTEILGEAILESLTRPTEE